MPSRLCLEVPFWGLFRGNQIVITLLKRIVYSVIKCRLGGNRYLITM